MQHSRDGALQHAIRGDALRWCIHRRQAVTICYITYGTIAATGGHMYTVRHFAHTDNERAHIMKKSFDAKTQTAHFTFDDGLPEITLAAADIHEDNQIEFLGHGVLQRLGDAAAIPRTQKDGTVITITEAMRHVEVLALRNHYASGSPDWNIAGRTRAAPENAVIRAIATKLGVTYAEAEAEVSRRMLAEMTA